MDKILSIYDGRMSRNLILLIQKSFNRVLTLIPKSCSDDKCNRVLTITCNRVKTIK